MAAGFALIAPFIACGFYVISFHLEQETPLTWATVFSSVRGMVGRDLGWMALITGFALYIWVDIAAILYFTFMGLRKISFNELVAEVFSTQMGLILLFVGNITGAMIAFFVFSISVVSFPMLFHRDIDFVTAMVTSVRFVIRNPLPLAFWCFLIAFLIGVSILSGLVGLLVILPVLGHATWHLYRRAVAPAPTGGASSAS
nr:DUF2189 domain-containing protein [Sneathiella chinensis]